MHRLQYLFVHCSLILGVSSLSPAFIEPEGSLPCSQQLGAGPYSEPDAPGPQLSYFPKIHSNIILLPTSRSSKWSLSFKFSDQILAFTSHLYRACYMSLPYHPLPFHHLNNIWSSLKLWSSSLCSFLQLPTPAYSTYFSCFVSSLCETKNNEICSSYAQSVERLGYGLDDWGSRVRFLVGAGNFFLEHRVQNGSGAHPASYPMGTRGSFPGGKVAGTWSWPLTCI
jgi:hypothetical protein